MSTTIFRYPLWRITVAVAFLFAVLISSTTLQSSEKGSPYYWLGNEKVALQKSEKWVVVEVSPTHKGDVSAEARSSNLTIKDQIKSDKILYWLESDEGMRVADALDKFKARVKITRTFPAYTTTTSPEKQRGRVLIDEVAVRFKPEVTQTDISSITALLGITIRNISSSGRYLFSVPSGSHYSTLEVANRIYEMGVAEWSEPNFLAQITFHDDPLLGRQWFLDNTGQLCCGAPSDVDINAAEAWGITTGSSSIKVAVIDAGVEAHEDLPSGKLVDGWTIGGGDGSPETDNAHGQAIAGIIAAQHNSLGVRGIAPGVMIESICVYPGFAITLADLAHAIDTARERGADVISISWGTEESSSISEAIQYALDNGRGGKGCFVVASAGNTGDTSVAFPAKIPDVICVGAVSFRNVKASYSPSNATIDFVAPSSDYNNGPPIDTHYVEMHYGNGGDTGIVTLDFMGSAGYSTGNYDYTFGGTSAAAPQVAATAALLLSFSSNLTWQEVDTFLTISADDYGSTNWDGAGRVNAFGALIAAGAEPPNPKAAFRENRENRSEFKLVGIYPNPFNPSTLLSYSIPENGHVTLTITDLLGRTVATLVDEIQAGGFHTARWNSEGVAGGVYFSRLAFGYLTDTKKLVLVR